MGNIRKRSKSSWTIQWDEPPGLDGRRRQRSKAIKGTRREAEVALAQIEHRIRVGEYVEPNKVTVGEQLDNWLKKYASARVSPKTLQEYEGIVKNHLEPALGHLLLQQLSPLHVQNYYAQALRTGRLDGKGGLSPQTIRHQHAVLHQACAQAVRWQLLNRNPIDAVDPPKVPKTEMRVLDEAEISALLSASRETELYIPVLIALSTGLRRGEVLGLTWNSIDLDSGTLMVQRSIEQTRGGVRAKEPKTHRSCRPVKMPPSLIARLRSCKASATLREGVQFKGDSYICVRDDGTLWPPDVLSHRFSDLVKSLDEITKIRFHDLRHTFATNALRYGVHPKIVGEMLGHSSVTVTLDTYSHILPDMQDQAVGQIELLLQKVIGT